MKSCVTVSLVPQAKGGPFVFWEDLPGSIQQAREVGFDSIEIFPPGPDEIDPIALKADLDSSGLGLAAVGTGAGWVVHRLHLTHADPSIRNRAKAFIRSIIDFAAPFQAPAIIGSMQGRFEGEIPKDQAMEWLAEGLVELSGYAAKRGTVLLYEPLNRYETNLINRLGDGVEFLQRHQIENVRLLADLFHMNIEESSLSDALRAAGKWVGHIHFVDSNRRPAGLGHLNFSPIIQALKDVSYEGFLSAEAFPYPDPLSAARQTIQSYRSLVN